MVVKIFVKDIFNWLFIILIFEFNICFGREVNLFFFYIFIVEELLIVVSKNKVIFKCKIC